MKEEPKYYIPSIEEFHVGFEYEIYSDGQPPIIFSELLTIPEGWHQHKITFPDQLIGLDTFLEMYPGIVRVKHLDQSDIESCGFNLSDVIIDGNRYYNEDETISIVIKENICRIYLRDRLQSTYLMVFQGTVKNLSEFKTILKQIGYEK